MVLRLPGELKRGVCTLDAAVKSGKSRTDCCVKFCGKISVGTVSIADRCELDWWCCDSVVGSRGPSVVLLHQYVIGMQIPTWLILPVVICLSQRLSHACLSTGLK